MSPTTVIVGAGLSGLMVARRLHDRGASVRVLEKSRGLGGRLASKRVGGLTFDSGAQYFGVRDTGFVDLVENWREHGVVAEWPGAPAGRWMGRPGMTAPAKFLAAGLDVRRDHKVTSVVRDGRGSWEIEMEGRETIPADQLVLSAPLPQSLALLVQGGVSLPPSLAAELALISYEPCLALLVTLSGPSLLPAEGVAFAGGPVRWMADNRLKFGQPGGPGAVTVHTHPAFAAAHYSAGEDEVAGLLLPELRPWMGGAEVVTATLHRWKYSEPKTTFREPCVWIPGLKLGLCGDAFGGPRVEGAAVSGLAMARMLT